MTVRSLHVTGAYCPNHHCLYMQYNHKAIDLAKKGGHKDVVEYLNKVCIHV